MGLELHLHAITVGLASFLPYQFMVGLLKKATIERGVDQGEFGRAVTCSLTLDPAEEAAQVPGLVQDSLDIWLSVLRYSQIKVHVTRSSY